MGPSLVVSIVGWVVGIQKFPDAPILLVHCQDVKKVPQPSVVRSWITTPSPVSAPAVPVLGASTVAHTSQGSPSIDVLPPDERVVLADVDSAGVHSASGSQVSDRSRMNIDGSRMGVSSSSVFSADLPFSAYIIRIDGSCFTSVHDAQIGCGPYSAVDNCPCSQLLDGCNKLFGWL